VLAAGCPVATAVAQTSYDAADRGKYLPAEAPEAFGGNLPERPIQVLGAHAGRVYPVVNANGSRPVVLVEGNRLDAQEDGGLFVVPASGFGPGHAKFIDLQLTHFDRGREGSHFESKSDFIGWVESTELLERCFVLVVVVDERDFLLDTKEPGYGAALVDVGRLEPSDRKKFTLTFPGIARQTRLRWLTALFSNGQQVRCDGGIGSFSTFLDRRERYRLKKETTARAKAGLDLPVALFRTMPIELNESLRSRWVGTRAEVELTINA
jgi:hypothetical protein